TQKLIHRGAKVVLKKMKERGIEGVTESKVKEAIKGCEICKMYSPVRRKTYQKVEANQPGERVGFNIMEPVRGQYIFVATDYFTRIRFAQGSNKKETKRVLEFLKKVRDKLKMKTLVTDGA
ncbi:hypothetical protein PAEPH01_1950, partial [Pancytospora epiphaga]